MEKITISGPAELLAVLPFHLGFRPRRSVVLVCFHGRRMGLVVRLDVCPRTDAPDVVAQLRPALAAEAPSNVVLVGYEDDAGESAPLCDALEELAEAEHLELSDRLVVRGGRWFGLLCECCPEDGTPLTAEEDVPGVAGFVVRGRAALDDRAALAALIDPAPDSSAEAGDAIREFVDELEWARGLVTIPVDDTFSRVRAVDDAELDRLVEEALAAWGRLLQGDVPDEVRPDDLPALVGCLRDVHIRDALIAWLCPGTLGHDALQPALAGALEEHLGPFGDEPSPGPSAPSRHPGGHAPEHVRSRLEALCRATPTEHAVPVLSVTASHAWWCGDGARAGVALERALELEPDHRLCALLRRLVRLGIRTQRASA